jgi:hypothetical protein
VQIQIHNDRDPEGLPIRGQRADLIRPCVTKEELGSIIKDFGKGDTERTGRALSALKRAETVRLMLTTEVATREKDSRSGVLSDLLIASVDDSAERAAGVCRC